MSYFLMHKDAKVALFSLVNDRIFYMTINNEKRELRLGSMTSKA